MHNICNWIYHIKVLKIKMRKIIGFFCLLISTATFAQINNNADSIFTHKYTIILDAGHGGNDTGVKTDEFQEKDIVLNIANVIKDNNPSSNINFVMLRNGDEQIINTQRANKINELKPDLVLSLHVNYNIKETVEGTETHVSPMNAFYDKAKELAEKISTNISSLGFKNLGVIDTNSKVLRDSKTPTVMIEIGYLTNDADRKYLTNDKNYINIAKQIYKALGLN